MPRAAQIPLDDPLRDPPSNWSRTEWVKERTVPANSTESGNDVDRVAAPDATRR